MKRKVLILMALLMLLNAGCTRMPSGESTGETAALATEPTLGNVDPPLESVPQTTLAPDPTEQTLEPTVAPTLPTDPTNSADPTQSIVPTYSTQPTYITDPVYPTDSTYYTDPTYSTDPVYPTDPTYATDPVYSTGSTHATNPAYPTDPTYAPQPTQPTQPAQTTQPTQPTQPAQTTQPPHYDNPPSTQMTVAPATTAPTAPATTNPTLPAPTQPVIVPTTKPTQIPVTAPATEPPTDNGCEHDYQQTYTKAATCTAVGSKKFVCRKCGAVMRQEIPMKAHSYTAATCLKPKTCSVCSATEGSALGHSYGANHLCIRCGVKDPSASPESMPVNFVATIRSDDGVLIPGITVTVYTTKSGSASAGSAVTNQKGVANIALSAGSTIYTVKLSNVPAEYQAQASYSFNSAQVTINLKARPVRTDPNDHSKARYEEGDEMMEFTMTDVDGKTYKLSELVQENKLVILDFWYVTCNPCKEEFPYFNAALEAYGDDVIILAVDPFYSAGDIRNLRDEMGLNFPVFQDALGLAKGFGVESYPTTVFIDSTGTIRMIHRSAFANQAAFLNAIAAYL